MEQAWTEWELPILRRIAQWENDYSDGIGRLNSDEVFNWYPEEDQRRVSLALARLHEAGLIEGVEVAQAPYPVIITRLTASGLEAAGVWPTPDSLVEALVAALQAEAERLDSAEQDKANRLRAAAKALRDLGANIVTAVLVEYMKRGLPGL